MAGSPELAPILEMLNATRASARERQGEIERKIRAEARKLRQGDAAGLSPVQLQPVGTVNDHTEEAPCGLVCSYSKSKSLQVQANLFAQPCYTAEICSMAAVVCRCRTGHEWGCNPRKIAGGS